jgi:HicB family
MRTTIRLEEDLLKEAKVRAAEQGITLNQMINESLREYLSARSQRQRVEPFRLRSYGKDGLRPGVSLDNNRAVGDLMDEDIWLLQDGSSA